MIPNNHQSPQTLRFSRKELLLAVLGGGCGLLMALPFSPLLSLGSVLFACLPFVYTGYTLPWAQGRNICFLAIALASLSLVLNGRLALPSFLSFTLCFALPSYILAYQAKQPQQKRLFPLNLTLAFLALGAVLFHYWIFSGQQPALEQLSQKLMENLPLASQGKVDLQDQIALVFKLLPSFSALGMLGIWLLSLYMTHQVVHRENPHPPSLGIFEDKEIAGNYYWVIAFLLASALFAPMPWNVLAQNLVWIAFLPVVLAGLGLVHIFCQKSPYKKTLLVVFYVLLLLIGWPIIFLVGGIGFIEPWVHLRQKLKSD